MESPFSPRPQVSNCGSEEQPCELSCNLDCAPNTVDAATMCMLTLEGKLDDSRKICDFPDGNQVVFEGALPEGKGNLSQYTFSLTLSQRGKTCLTLNSQPLPWNGGGTYSKTTAVSSRGSYSQEVWGESRTSGTGDARSGRLPDAGRPPTVSRIRLRCADEQTYSAEGAGICTALEDASPARVGPPLLELRVTHQQSYEFTLLSGSRVATLFTCK
jgi:hypothetical protein